MNPIFKTVLLLSSSSLSFFQSFCQEKSQSIIAEADSFFAVRDWRSASHLYESALTDATNNSLAWNRFGFANYSLGKYDDALKNYNKSLSQHPGPFLRSLVFSRMAKVYAIKNDKKAAFIALDSAISLGYNNVSEMDSLSDFNSLRGESYFNHLRQQVYVNRNPCMVDAHAREFDFWVGEWDVYQTGTKNLVGHSLVQMISGGCALLENWDSPASTGKSINFIDPVSNTWKQSWAGSYANGTQEFTNGQYKDSAMQFVFEMRNPNGNKIIGRFIFYNQGPNQVRQFNETSSDGGKTWVTSYDFTYIRRR